VQCRKMIQDGARRTYHGRVEMAVQADVCGAGRVGMQISQRNELVIESLAAFSSTEGQISNLIPP
jgi:hypothetical protein